MKCNPTKGGNGLAADSGNPCDFCLLLDRQCWPRFRAPGQNCSNCDAENVHCLSSHDVRLHPEDPDRRLEYLSLEHIHTLGVPFGHLMARGPHQSGLPLLAQFPETDHANISLASPDIDEGDDEEASQGSFGDETPVTVASPWSLTYSESIGSDDNGPLPEYFPPEADTSSQLMDNHSVKPHLHSPCNSILMPAPTFQRHFVVPCATNENFVERRLILDRVLRTLSPQFGGKTVVLDGLPGAGKTEMAFRVAYEVRHCFPDCSVFWLSATSASNLQNSYRNIAQALGIPLDGHTDVVTVNRAIGQLTTGNWLYIIDTNGFMEPADGGALWNNLPRSNRGSILITTRNRQGAWELGVEPQNIINVSSMENDEALELFYQNMTVNTTEMRSISQLILMLDHLALAIIAARKQIRRLSVSVDQYLELHHHLHWPLDAVLSLPERLGHSFSDIMAVNEYAWELLCFMSYLHPNRIPFLLLPEPSGEGSKGQAIKALKARSFIVDEQQLGLVAMSQIVHTSLRNWLVHQGKHREKVDLIVRHLLATVPAPMATGNFWRPYLPHLGSVLSFEESCSERESVIRLRINLGRGLWVAQRFKEAERELKQCVLTSLRHLDDRNPLKAYCMEVLGFFFLDQRKSARAEMYFLGTRRLRVQIYEPGDERITICYDYLTLVAMREGRVEDAKSHFLNSAIINTWPGVDWKSDMMKDVLVELERKFFSYFPTIE